MARGRKSTEMDALRQRRFGQCCSDLGETNAIPRSTEYDLMPARSMGRVFVADEFNFKVKAPGNKVTRGESE